MSHGTPTLEEARHTIIKKEIASDSDINVGLCHEQSMSVPRFGIIDFPGAGSALAAWPASAGQPPAQSRLIVSLLP
jgi:hypothetical protein